MYIVLWVHIPNFYEGKQVGTSPVVPIPSIFN